ncbi:aminotransferase class I/II-fold pyridoxal phosphate-dependent enzyme [Streptomyces sp. NPDC002055]|uniref:pyridoxal phosphate-dependent decarboxylase family protein n=1 Tax=Streptomyces sp. NPDC002055 TaxID=3154534 RepID=UPI003316CCEA
MTGDQPGPQHTETPPRAASPLEPEDWEEFRALGKQIIDDVVDHFAGIRERPVWQPVPDEVRTALSAGLPTGPLPMTAVYEEFRSLILPYPRGNTHPRFWGWVNGSGLPVAAYADLLASAMNATLGAGENAAMLVEEQVVTWLQQAFDWPETGSGLLTSGCSMGQIIALAAARQSRAAEWNIRHAGAREAPQLTVYGSTETHHSFEKAVELLGIGRAFYRTVPVGPDFRIDVPALRRAIRKDRAEGLRPVCLVGNVGTVNTGAVDPLDDLVDVAREEDLWLHLDGAFGAFAYLLPERRPLLAALNRADSLVFDLHKWFYLPFDVSCVLVREPGALEDTFSSHADYISRTPSGPASNPVAFADRGIEQSRRFRALKVWFALRTHGLDGFARAIAGNIDQIGHLTRLVDASPRLETVSRSPLNIACFRYVRPGAGPDELNALNQEILSRLQLRGLAVPSHTLIDGKFVIRVANTNHRTVRSDMDFLVDQVVALGDGLLKDGMLDDGAGEGH